MEPEIDVQNEPEKVKGSPLYGGVVAFLSSLCCIVPLAVVLLGFGGASFLLRMTKYRPYFIVFSLIVMAGALWWTWRRNQSCCTSLEQQQRLNKTLAMMVGAYLVVFLGLSYGLPPLINRYQVPTVTRNGGESSGQFVNGAATKRIDVKVEGLTCPACPATIHSLLTAEPGIEDAQVGYPDGKGYVLFNDSVTKAKIINKLIDAGYKVEITGESKLAD